VLSGVGEVAERYERITVAPNRFEVLHLPGHDTLIRAGEIRAEWSSRDGRSGFFYYNPARAKGEDPSS